MTQFPAIAGFLLLKCSVEGEAPFVRISVIPGLEQDSGAQITPIGELEWRHLSCHKKGVVLVNIFHLRDSTMKTPQIFSALALLFGLLGSGSAYAQVVYHVDFENGSIEATVGSSRAEASHGSITAVANPSPDGRNGSALVGRIQAVSNTEKVRAELASQRLPTEGKVYRYRWSYFIPDDFFEDAEFETVPPEPYWLANAQWKSWPCEVCNSTYDPAICGGCGGIFNEVRVLDESDWEFRWRAEPDCHDLYEPIATGVWVDFEMLIYWTKGSDGYMRLWRDDALIDSLDNVRTLFTSFEPETCDIYWAVGLYARWYGDKEELVMYIDDIEIVDETELSCIEGEACDDLNLCTTDDSCQEGLCGGTPVSCVASSCHSAYCDLATGQCVSEALADGSPCDDGDICTVNESCQQGQCQGGEDQCSDDPVDEGAPSDEAVVEVLDQSSQGDLSQDSGEDQSQVADQSEAESEGLAEPGESSDEGCGCQLRGRAQGSSWWWMALLGGLGWVLVRRREAA